MMLPSPVRRDRCVQCERPQSTCICRWITPTENRVEVLLLQHPLEAHNAKGSARLLQLSLLRSRMATAEIFADATLQALLFEPFEPDGTSPHGGTQAILLYPSTPEDEDLSASLRPTLTAAMRVDLTRLRLIVIDGTWRKSRKMLHLSPLLQRLPRLSLNDVPASRYQIRKAHGADQLSTLEATCLALMQLEADAAKFQPLLTAFDGFVTQQLAQRDAGVAGGPKFKKDTPASG